MRQFLIDGYFVRKRLKRMVIIMKTVLLLLIRFYRRFISPLKPPTCRFYPTCSSYASTAVSKHGALRGGFLAFKRILKCHPFHPGGVDHVPEQLEAAHDTRCRCENN